MHELVNHKGNFTLLTLKQNENNPCIYNNLSTAFRVVTLTCMPIVLHNEGNYLIQTTMWNSPSVFQIMNLRCHKHKDKSYTVNVMRTGSLDV